MVTGFLGPNGAGKTTTLRALLGLVEPTSGTATIGGLRYAELTDPLRVVGAALESSSFHPARSGLAHLRIYCAVAGIPDQRAVEVLEFVGLGEVGHRKVRGYSLGMRQRLALAAALLGDPPVLILDEPANGLDPEGIAWLRALLRELAHEGRTVLVSSHALAEVEQTVDQVVIVHRGRLVRQAGLAELAQEHSATVRAGGPDPHALFRALAGTGAEIQWAGGRELRIRGIDAAMVGHLAHTARIELHELSTQRGDLEEVFLALISEGVPAATS
ncbi:MAG: ATP-binding cassette domain-containing protein [Pseudonocardiales bacterium]|nr:ATP-binding cassette domain-containing protein [Pseudonocardiales bacterium]MBV9029097.1 ATP-binding cassette domain-containing protein [Pseudonocardiales bacterium]